MKRWPTMPLCDVALCLDSRRIPIKEDERQKRSGAVPYYGANGQVGWIDEAIFDEPLLLIAEDGGHFEEPERGVAYTVHGPAWVNNHAHVLRADEKTIKLDFIGYYFVRFDFRPYITGTTRAKLTQRDLMRVPVPVPPLEEQERIVRLLDEADELRKLRAQADERTAKLIPALFHEAFGEMNREKGRWRFERLSELIRIEARLVDPRADEYRDLPHIGPDRIEKETGKLLPSKSAREDGQISAKFLFDERDVLYSKIRPNLRKVALPDRRGLCSADMYPVRPGNRMTREFLWAFLLTDYFTERAVDLSARVNMPKLNRDQLDSIEAPVPPLGLQTVFADRVRKIRELECEQVGSRQRLDDLFQSMLHRAFEGEL